jgi:quercetin dioxygenase-like cupin family protein
VSEKRSRLNIEDKYHMPHSEARAFNGLMVPDQSGSRITAPEPGLQREILAHTPSMMLVRHDICQGWRGAAHRHPHEQLIYVIRGRIQFEANGAKFDAVAGDNFIVASNVEHQATALEDSVVLDVFTPAREDYL